jgi:energy-converting hydrogenase Eha subunit A
MSEYLRSSPHFFRPVKRSMLAFVVALLLLAAILPAPLELAADRAHPPNPAKSAWFLVWIQELVSYSTFAVYGVVVLAAILIALPWLPLEAPERAAWCPRTLRGVTWPTIAVAGAILVLTWVGLVLRGANWAFVSPF